MKRSLFIILCFAACCLFLGSCSTPLYIEPAKAPRTDYVEPNMEFIGFVNTQRNEYMLQLFNKFGRELEKSNIALNHQQYSLGSQFNVESLYSYESTMRYVSYVYVKNLHIKYNDDVLDNMSLKKAASLVAGLSLFTLFQVYLPMYAAADVDKTQQNIFLEADLCVYDTHKHELIQTIPINFYGSEIYSGQYKNRQTNFRLLMESERSVLTNVLLGYFGQLHVDLQQIKASSSRK